MSKSNQINNVKGWAAACTGTTEELSRSTVLPKGVPVYNIDTGELKLADGTNYPAGLPDHRHPNTYSPLGHVHLKKNEEPWFMANPQLWFIDDLPNHPELLALTGGELPIADVSEQVRLMYSGTSPISGEFIYDEGTSTYSNDIVEVTVSDTYSNYTLDNVFREALEFDDVIDTSRQWLMNELQEVTINFKFKGDHKYYIDKYQMVPAFGTAGLTGLLRPTPNSWTLEASDDGVTWETVDHQSDITTGWETFEVRQFDLATLVVGTYFKLTIHSWNNEGNGADVRAGLRRLWLSVAKEGIFVLPEVPSPHDDFVWVIPRADMKVGMHHETVGDICYPTGLTENIAPNRIPALGGYYSSITYESLFDTIGHRHSTDTAAFTAVAVGGLTYHADEKRVTASAAVSSYIELTQSAPLDEVFNGLNFINSQNKPIHVVIEYKVSDNNYVVLADIADFRTVVTETGMNDQMVTRMLLPLDQSLPAITYQVLRINFLTWENSGAVDLRLVVTSNLIDQFRVPQIVTDDNTTPHIVVSNMVHDVTPEIIQQLQSNQIDTNQVLATLINRVNKLDPEYEGEVTP